ncbi:hypothetical protein [Embleya sp. NBC_00896]|uniref:hypothetical protein n=1 Tax=Embleya sp. NBC_00896 TaxID=2975961 RepID=UPI00387066DB|nr:hypothetical protein OG928_02985 [Embleya sp. NBC_00896]
MCGRPIAGHTVSEADGFSVTIRSVHVERPDLPAEVEAVINAPTPMGMNPSEIYPTVLVLRDGVVVGPGRMKSRMLREPLWGPRYEWPAVERQRATEGLCDDTWANVWAHPSRYELAVVMTPPRTGPATGSPVTTEDDLGDRPVLIAKARLSDIPVRP